MAKSKKPSNHCPCGSGLSFNKCCGPIIRRQRDADTAEELMRSRYTAFVKGNSAYLHYSWHPDTAPGAIGDLPVGQWAPLEILSTHLGTGEDATGVVEFRSSYSDGTHDHTIHEVSTFGRTECRWVYVDGESKTGRE